MASIRKKALHGNHKNQIKSPTIKRSPSSSVILQGWLFKQGSDGLMLWKKRWFVLADYCLFYYKGPAEEKLLGSCLLASYKISPCTSEDKIYRKFSFKAEHANMRTYYFSAESQASMIQWINALSLASICQENRNDNLESGKIESWVVSEHQPLYVNTPPKPKQVLEAPEIPPNRIYPENLNGDNPTYLQYATRGNVPQHAPAGMTAYPQRPYSQLPYRNNHLPVKYEQSPFIYATPPIRNKPTEIQRNPAPYPPNVLNNRAPVVQVEREIVQPKKFPPRPHSADFLEHDYKECRQVYYQNETARSNDLSKLQRPKSSLDVIRYNDYSYDSLHWSEEAYAEKMRQTSLYVTPHYRGTDKNNAQVASFPKDQITHQANMDKRYYPKDHSEIRYDYSYDASKFNRSASARFPLQSRGDHLNSSYDEGTSKIKKSTSERDNKGNSSEEFQREESMQRLLVWKQRMLQSPLTRKTSSGSARQSLIPNKLENNSHQKKFMNKDDSIVEGTNVSAGSSGNQSIENYSEKIPYRKKSHSKENPKFQYHSLSSDEDDMSRLCDREGRKHNHKPSYNKKSALKSYSNLIPSNNIESSDNTTSRANRNTNGKYLIGLGAVAGPSRAEPLVLSQPGLFDEPLRDIMDSPQFAIDSNETSSTTTIPSITCHDNKSSIDRSCIAESQSPISNKPSDSGYSTLQGGILLKNSCCNELNLTQCSTNYSYDSTNETEVQDTKKEWGLKLDESRVIKEFSYHYINAKNEDSKRSLWVAEDENNAANFPDPSVDKEQSEGKEDDSAKTTILREAPINVFSVKGKTDGLDIDDTNTFSQSVPENTILSDLHKSAKIKDNYTEEETEEMTPEQTFDAYYSNSNKPNTILNKKKAGSSSSDFPKDALFSDHNSCNTLSSDEDRDDEVAAVLGKHQKIVYDTQCLKNDNLNGSLNAEAENSEAEVLNSNSTLFPVSSTDCLDEKSKEEHYMPMTPKKKIISSPVNESAYVSRNPSVSSFYATENSEHILEESSYVEMSHNSTSSSNNGIRAFKPSGEGSVTPGSSELQLFEDNPDYEYISKDLSEPVYVELSSSFRERKNAPLKSSFTKELQISKNGKDHLYYSSLKHSLPDILNTSSPQCTLNSTKSDSSDADDEASKDLDCITTPTHPRFSLSDTFRPASYYLGANHSAGAFIGLNLEQQDSSDSDLVSPPPIPVSTPPVDELGLSLDLVKTCTLTPKEEKEGFLGDPSCNYWKALPGCDRDHKTKKLSNRYLPSRPMEDLSSETDSVDSFRKEQLLKRRPVSADILDNLSESNFLSSSPSSRRKSVGSDIESVGFSNPEDRSVNYDNLSEDLQVNDQFLESLMKSNPDNVSNILNINPSIEKQSSIDSRFKINNVIWEYEKKKNDVDSEMTESIYKKYCKHKVISLTPQTSCSGIIQGQTIAMHGQSGAPYYYSDILKSGGSNQSAVTFDTTNSSQSTSSPPLNNNNKLRKMKNNMANSSDSSDKDNHSRQNSAKSASDRKKIMDSINRTNKNINPSNLISKDGKGPSAKILSRSLTPDFHSKKHSSGIHENKQSKIMKNITSQDGTDSSLRRARSFDGLLDDSEPSEEKPRVLRASPSDAIFKLLQTTQNQGKSQDYSEKVLFPNESFKRSVQDNSGAIQGLDSNQVHHKGSETLRLARSLDNLKWQSESPKMRKPFIDNGENFNSTPLLRNINDLNKDDMCDPSNSSDTSYRTDDGQTGSICKSLSGVDNYKDTERGALGRGNSDIHLESSIQGSHIISFENKHGLIQWGSVSSSPCDMIVRSNEDKQMHGSQLTSTIAGTSTSGSSCGIILSQNGNSTITTASGDNWNLELSAGELLGRTHEELVLLLIQLRRRSSGLCKAIDDFQKEISSKVKSMEEDPSKSIESTKSEELKKQLMDLEKQYEKGKPLVNLVDNMVKLGSLYHNNMNASPSSSMPQRREFNHKVQEQRLLAEEKKEWERLPPDQKQLQEKVKQLYKLDQILKKESSTLQNLQQDKALLEQALTGLRQKLDTMHGNPVETEQCRHQQRMLEKGLTRVRSVLAQNSKKLEETVAENARLEQELVILRQKLQFSRKAVEPGSTTVALESELKRVQDLVGDLQRQRQYLCLQVRQLTEKSNSLSQQIEPLTFEAPGTSNVSPKRRTPSSWVETDLDSQITQDVGIENQYNQQNSTASTYVICDSNKKTCIIHKEKPQEIKTVRIVKRESERRQRDRERNGTLGIPLINIISRRETIVEESPGSSSSNETTSCQNVPDNFGLPPEDTWSIPHISSNPPPLTPRTDSVNAVKNFVNKHKQLKEDILLSNTPSTENCQVESYQNSEDLAPVYLSKAAQEIVQEVAWRKKGEKRLVPKEKRRYHTVSGQSLFQEFSNFSSIGSRDDLDMERALRNRVHTPDVVRSTLSRDAKFTAETIDTILGTPSKIVIPERYKPETEPQISKEELLQRSRKAEAIRKMLTQSSTITTETTEGNRDSNYNSAQYKYKIAEEKQQREHLLQLNQILAQQVTEKSKIVAVSASTANLMRNYESSESDSDTSPEEPLPLVQQRENYFS